MDGLNSEVTAGDAVESIENLLADLDMEGSADSVTEVIEELSGSELDAVEQHEAISAAYDDQETSSVEVSAPEATAEAPAAEEAPAKTKKARAPKTPKAPSAPKDLSTVPAEFFVLSDGITDIEANKATVIGMVPNQKKVAEKFENLFRAVSVGKRPSTYVMDCFDVLNAKGEATSTEMVAALKADGYAEGTARSQTGQIMILFHTLGIAVREGQKLTLNREAPMTKRLAALPAAKA